MIKTVCRFHGAVAQSKQRGDSKDSHDRVAIASSQTGRPKLSPIMHVVLDHGFVRTAVRAIYRHPKTPEIGTVALEVLLFLIEVNDGPEGKFRRAVLAMLSRPPERVLTLIMGAGHFSEGGHIGPLRSCLKVLGAMCPMAPSTGLVPRLPVGREGEAAEYLLNIFQRHWSDEQLCMSTLHLFVGFTCSAPMAAAFYDAGVTEALRQFLVRCSSGEVQNDWRPQGVEKVRFGLSGRGKQALRQATEALFALRKRIGQCECLVWELLKDLTNLCSVRLQEADRQTSRLSKQSGGSDSKASRQQSKAEEGFMADSGRTIALALKELIRVPHGGQWQPAITCLTELVTSDRALHCQRVLDGNCLPLLLQEVRESQASIALPLLRVLVFADGDAPKAALSKGEVAVEDGDYDAPAKSFGVGDNAEDPAHQQAEGLPWHSAREWLAGNRGVAELFCAVETHASSATLQEGLLRILGEVIARPGPAQQTVLTECDRHNKASRSTGRRGSSSHCMVFEDVSADKPGGGIGTLVRTVRSHIEDPHAISGGLHSLCELLRLDAKLATKYAVIPDLIDCLMDVVWGFLRGPVDLRRRSLLLLTQIREAVPALTDTMSGMWGGHKAEYLKRVPQPGASLQGQLAHQEVSKGGEECHDDDDDVEEPPLAAEPEHSPTPLMAPEAEHSPTPLLAAEHGHSPTSRGGSSAAEQADEEVEVDANVVDVEAQQLEGQDGFEGEERPAYSEEEREVSPSPPSRKLSANEKSRVVLKPERNHDSLAGDSIDEPSAEDLTREVITKAAPSSKLPATLPGDVRRFGAYLCVHDFLLSKGSGPLEDVVAAMQEHQEDQEINVVAIRGLMKGQEEVLVKRFANLAEMPSFIYTVRHVVLRFPLQEVALLSMCLTTRLVDIVQHKPPEDIEDFLEVCTLTVCTTLDTTEVWTTKEWEPLLEAIDILAGDSGSDAGRRFVTRLDVLARLDEEWEKVQVAARDDFVARDIVKAFKEDTERLLKM